MSVQVCFYVGCLRKDLTSKKKNVKKRHHEGFVDLFKVNSEDTKSPLFLHGFNFQKV